MPVKNTETGEVHRGQKGGKTKCGFDTSASHGIGQTEAIISKKDGCINQEI